MRNRTRLNNRDKALINRFHEILRSGKDYDAESIYEDAGKDFFLSGKRVQEIISLHYRSQVITCDMIVYELSLNGAFEDVIEQFALHFSLCNRESRLIIRYIKRMQYETSIKRKHNSQN